MAYGNNNNGGGNNVRTDRFGNPYQLRTALQVTTKDGENINVFKTGVELGGKYYVIEISHRNKEHKSGKDGMWVKITKKQKQQNRASQSM